ncbi:hypothetical protein ABPG75_009188 [Micractinium tetrahymenae]
MQLVLVTGGTSQCSDRSPIPFNAAPEPKTPKLRSGDSKLEPGVDPNALVDTASGCETALHAAVRRGHLECAEQLLDMGAQPDKPNSSQETPLHVAAQYGRTSCA